MKLEGEDQPRTYNTKENRNQKEIITLQICQFIFVIHICRSNFKLVGHGEVHSNEWFSLWLTTSYYVLLETLSLIFKWHIRFQFHQCAYTKLLRMQIPKVQKAAILDCLFALLGPAWVKAAHKMLVKLTPGIFIVNLKINDFD